MQFGDPIVLVICLLDKFRISCFLLFQLSQCVIQFLAQLILFLLLLLQLRLQICNLDVTFFPAAMFLPDQDSVFSFRILQFLFVRSILVIDDFGIGLHLLYHIHLLCDALHEIF